MKEFVKGDTVRHGTGHEKYRLLRPVTYNDVDCWEARNQRTQGLHLLRADKIRRTR
jgi:hypothetical protein